MCSEGLGNLVSVWQQIAGGQWIGHTPWGYLCSGERPVFFHHNTNASAQPWQLPLPQDTLKCRYFSPSSATNSYLSSPSLISHLVLAVTSNVFIPTVKALHTPSSLYFHSSSSFSRLDLCGPARCFTTSANRSFAIAQSGPDQGLETHTRFPAFSMLEKPQVSMSLEPHWLQRALIQPVKYTPPKLSCFA